MLLRSFIVLHIRMPPSPGIHHAALELAAFGGAAAQPCWLAVAVRRLVLAVYCGLRRPAGCVVRGPSWTKQNESA